MATTSGTMSMPASGSVELVTELLWQHAMTHLQKTNNEILLPIDIRSIVGGASIEVIKTRLGKLLNTPVVAFEDSVNQVYRIMPTPALDGRIGAAVFPMGMAIDGRMAAHLPRGNEIVSQDIDCQVKAPKIPRPPNAFILYRQHHHPVIKSAHPEYHNNDISVLLGKKWKAETPETKAHFKALAEEIKKKHAEDNPGYQYAPRKPSEKRRRCTVRRNGPTSTQKHITGDGVDASLSLVQNGAPGLVQSDAEENGLSPASTGSVSANQREDFGTPPPVTTSSDFEDILANHSNQFVMGSQEGTFLNYGRRRHTPTSSISTANQLPPIPPLPQQLTMPQPSTEDPAHNSWTADVDFDFDDYFLEGAQ
ncbi:hypothetical protein MferCBS31731_002391 [Microsporum ferrugineum]|uniref:High mobility group domain protein n=1 Tax=Microsporum ferrugineum TaxID=77205 RepID=A0A2I6QB07_9EURO|nr:high mobility group domain protein [Microsporum ferrugineum]